MQNIDDSKVIVKRAVVASDFHIPHQSDTAIHLLEKVMRELQPEILVINGDLLDCPQISKYARVPGGSTLQEDIALAHSYLSDFRHILPNSKIYYIEGNHSFRIRSYLIAKAPELYDTYYIRDQLKLKELNIEWVGTNEGAARWIDTYIEIDGVYIGHFDKVSQHSAYTAKALVDKFGANLIQAHTHRIGYFSKRLLSGQELVGVEGGCLCDLRPSYSGHANWAHGFCIVSWTDSEHHIQPVHIKNYECLVDGKLYRLK